MSVIQLNFIEINDSSKYTMVMPYNTKVNMYASCEYFFPAIIIHIKSPKSTQEIIQ
jgi:hypothetical protein